MPETQTSVLAHRSSKRSFNPKPKIIMGNPKNEVFIRFMVILQNPNYKNQAKGMFSFRFIEIRETRSDIILLERSFSSWFIHILRNRPETNETLACLRGPEIQPDPRSAKEKPEKLEPPRKGCWEFPYSGERRIPKAVPCRQK